MKRMERKEERMNAGRCDSPQIKKEAKDKERK